MKHTELFSKIKAGDIAPCYLFEGEEEFIKHAALDALRKAVVAGDFSDMNDTSLTDPDADTLIAAAETLPFMADRRLILVRDSAMLLPNKAKKYDEEKSVKRLTEYLDRLPDTTVIVFYLRGKADGRKKLYTALKKKAALVSFDAPDDQELTKWIARRFARAGKQIDSTTCQNLWFTSGRDLTLLSNEIDKLIAYVGARDVIQRSDIEDISVKTTEFKVFDLSGALLGGEGARALRMLEGLLRDGENRLMLLSLLARQVRQLSYCKLLARCRAPRDQIASTIGVPPFAVQRTLALAERYTVKQLSDMEKWCVEAEYGVKSGGAPENGSLEGVMLRILALEGEHT